MYFFDCKSCCGIEEEISVLEPLLFPKEKGLTDHKRIDLLSLLEIQAQWMAMFMCLQMAFI